MRTIIIIKVAKFIFFIDLWSQTEGRAITASGYTNPLKDNMLKYIAYICFVVLLPAMGGCVLDHDIDPHSQSSRVLLVYVGTDNNLSGYEQAKIQGLRDGWTGRPNDRILVYRDNRSNNARLMEVSNLDPNETVREIAVYGTENSASPSTFNRVISDVIGMYPADSYGLLVFSHASGWLPEGVYNEFAAGKIPELALNSRSIIVDGTDEMELKEFAKAIPDGVFDYIVFEACFMAGIEVAYELRDKARYILASSAEIVDPGFAPVYSSATDKLLSADLPAFGQNVFNHTLTYAETNPQRSATYSVIRTAELDPLADFVRNNCDFLLEVELTEIQHFDRLNGFRLFFDFEDYYSRLLNTDAQRTELSRLIGECVLWKAATDKFMTQGSANYNGFSITKHSGLTSYIPQTIFPGLNAAYNELDWANRTK